jgi:hypothetical protein
LVQAHGIPRADIFVRARGISNSAGTKAAGADVESGHDGAQDRGLIEVSVDYHGKDADAVPKALQEAGAKSMKAK